MPQIHFELFTVFLLIITVFLSIITGLLVLELRAADIELKIPKLRKGSYFPSVLELRRRINRAHNVRHDGASVHGISTRKVVDPASALGVDAGISTSKVPKICAAFDEEINAFRARRESLLAGHCIRAL